MSHEHMHIGIGLVCLSLFCVVVWQYWLLRKFEISVAANESDISVYKFKGQIAKDALVPIGSNVDYRNCIVSFNGLTLFPDQDFTSPKRRFISFNFPIAKSDKLIIHKPDNGIVYVLEENEKMSFVGTTILL